MRAPNVCTIPPALPFLKTFVAALRGGTVVAGLDAATADTGFGLADVTIYVPTRRAAAALAAEFLEQSGRPSVILPHIRPLGALETAEAFAPFPAEADDEAEPDLAAPVPAAASEIWRRLQLAALIQGWARSIDGALRGVGSDGRPRVDPAEAFRVATSTVDAFALAGDLAGLIDEFRIEDVAWRELDTLRMAGFDDYWRITTTFLSIAVDAWPKILAAHGRIDPAQRQIERVEAQIRTLPARNGPVIAIGSTGTNKATARLLAAIARAPRGAVVLPGLDLDLDAASWALVSGPVADGQEPSFGHPQAALARLLPTLGVARADVRPLGTPAETGSLRARIVSEALRPADTTDQWRTFRRAHGQKRIAGALADVRLVEAADEREEALCLAVAMREVLETPGRTGALVTPDRDLARRVRGELLRWAIEVEDTGGEPLARRPLGILARLVSTAAARRGAQARDITALLAHPLACFGRPRADVADRAAQLEIGVLRAVALRGKDTGALFAEARARAGDIHAHPTQKALRTADWTEMEALWVALTAALTPMTSLVGPQSLERWIAAHRDALTAIAGAAAPEERDALDALFDELAADDSGLRFTAEDYDLFVGRLANEIVLRNTDRPHPRLQILGLLEARLLRADVMLLGGLDETIWPPPARTDPFLNRPMRCDLGLTPPERRIGQTAHDFEQAMGADTIILSRAAKRGGSPCVASRFLLRLEALCGPAWDQCRARGHELLTLARRLDWTKAPVPIARPRPKPPLHLRPRGLSVTQIETLRRDPYSIFAAHVLRLAPLPRIGEELEPSAFGSLMHEAVHRFATSPAASADPRGRRGALSAILREIFAPALQDASFEAFRWPLVQKAADVFLAFDGKQRQGIRDLITEIGGAIEIPLADLSTFSLRARADRIDFHRDGAATLVDYKTGQPPGNREVEVGFAPQLTLEAAMLARGGFGAPHAGPIHAVYVKLGGKDGGAVRPVVFKTQTFEDVVARHYDGLVRLVSSFRREDTPYPSRPFPKFAKASGDYDHLARVREWALAGDDEATP